MNEAEFQKALDKALVVYRENHGDRNGITLDTLRFWLIQQLEEELDCSLFSPRRAIEDEKRA